MSRRQHKRWRHPGAVCASGQRRVWAQPLHPGVGTSEIVHLLLHMGDPAEESISAHYRVMVLLQSIWAPLQTIVRHHVASSTESEAQDALDRLAYIAGPVLACQALEVHATEHAQIYQQLGIRRLTFHCLPPYQQNDIPVWGDLSPKDLVPEVRAAIDAATQARDMLSAVPADVFWPLEGALFSAVDESPRVSPRTWADVVAHPEQYTLLEVLVTVLYGKVQTRSQAAALPEVDHAGHWRLCKYCARASQEDEYIAIEWENRRLCPYGCGGEVGRDAWEWENVRRANPSLPEAPRKWVTYSNIQ
jgi:hypothetical protein